MIQAESLLIDRQRAVEERFGLRIFALRLKQKCEVVQDRGHMGVIRTEGLLRDTQCLPCNDHGLRVVSLAIKYLGLLIKFLQLRLLNLR